MLANGNLVVGETPVDSNDGSRELREDVISSRPLRIYGNGSSSLRGGVKDEDTVGRDRDRLPGSVDGGEGAVERGVCGEGERGGEEEGGL